MGIGNDNQCCAVNNMDASCWLYASMILMFCLFVGALVCLHVFLMTILADKEFFGFFLQDILTQSFL